MAIKVLSVRSSRDEVVLFPSAPLLYVDDRISLEASDLEDNSQGGYAEAVFFSYRTLHEILSGAKTHLSFEASNDDVDVDELEKGPSSSSIGGWRLNSRIISASLGRGRHIELQKPVNIFLRHIVTDPNVLKDPVCVFWDYEVHGWSDSGCRLVSSNQTFSECQCDHLTNFALLMRPVTSSSSAILSKVRLDIVAYVVTSVVLLAVLVMIFKVRHPFFSYALNFLLVCSLSTFFVGSRLVSLME